MKNTTANTAAMKSTNDKIQGGKQMKVTTFNSVLTAAVINTATQMGAYVPKGLKVEMVNGAIVSNGEALIMNAMFKGEISKRNAMIYKLDLDTAIYSNHVQETVEEVIATEEVTMVLADSPAPASHEEFVAKMEATKQTVKATAATLHLFKEMKAKRYAEVKAIKAAQKSKRKMIKAMFGFTLKAKQEKIELARLAKKGVRIEGMNKTGFLGQARKRALSKDLEITINTLKANASGKFEINVTTMHENEAIRLGLLSGGKTNARCGRNALAFDNFSKQLVVVDFAANKSQATGLTHFYIWWNGRSTIFSRLIDGVYYDLVTGNALKTRANAPRLFEVIGGSPSSLRKDQTLAFDVTNGYDLMDKILDAVTDGGYSKNKGKKSTTAQMSKYVTRFFAWTAPNKVIGVVTHPAIYFSKWAKDKMDGMGFVSSKFYATAVSNVLGVKFDVTSVEGLSVQCRPYSAKTNAVVVDMASQFDVLALEAKDVVYIENVTPAIDKELDLAFNGKGQYANSMVVFGPKGCDIEFVSDLHGYKTEFNWGAPSNFRVLDITKIEKHAIRNGANTSIQMWETPLSNDADATLEFMQTLRHEQVETIFKELYLDREASVPSLVDLNKNVHVQGIAKQIAPDYVLDKDFAMYKKVHEELFTRINKIDNRFKYEIDGCFNRIISDITCLAVNSGILQYGEAFIPNANDYFHSEENAERFMGETRVVRECYSKRIVSMFKYPKMGIKEFYKATLLPLEVIVSRIERLVKLGDMTPQIGESIIRFYTTLKAGTIVVPANDLLKQQCAGLDFDWDGASIIFDPRFNALLPEGISITNIKTDKEPIKAEQQAQNKGIKLSLTSLINKTDLNPNSGVIISAETLKESFLAYMTSDNGGWSVGSITNTNSTQIAVLILAKVTRKKKYFTLMKDMLISWFNHEGGVDEYVPLPRRTVDLSSMDAMFTFPAIDAEDQTPSIKATVVDVSPAAVATCIASIENANWNDPRTLVTIFEDLNEIFRYYQEITIDSAKTGERVTVSVAPGRKFHACMLNNNKLDWNWARSMDESMEKEEQTLTIDIVNTAPTEKKTPINDKLYDLRKSLAEDMAVMSAELLKAKDVKMALADVSYLATFFNNEKYLGTVGQTTKSLVGGMVKIKEIYGDLTANYIEARDAAGDDEDARSIAQEKYSEGLMALRSMGRNLTAHMTMTQRGAFAKFVASHRFPITKIAQKEKYTAIVDPTGGSTFASSVFAEEYLLYITKRFADINFCGEKLVYNEFYQDGDVITLDKGMSDYAATTANITGEFVVREVNGKFYATQLIEDVLKTRTIEESTLVRISDADETTLAKVAASLNKVGKVTLLAQSVKNEDSTFTHNYGVYSEGNNIANIDAQGSFANVVNGKQGKIKNIFCGVTEYNNVRKPYILALVK